MDQPFEVMPNGSSNERRDMANTLVVKTEAKLRVTSGANVDGEKFVSNIKLASLLLSQQTVRPIASSRQPWG